tara:strand:+ start:42327 stop:42554 length:228 start_codon:yes stop_codon:yes gene_type:complete
LNKASTPFYIVKSKFLFFSRFGLCAFITAKLKQQEVNKQQGSNDDNKSIHMPKLLDFYKVDAPSFKRLRQIIKKS